MQDKLSKIRLAAVMSDGSPGVQAYRWFTAIGMAAVGYLAFQTLQTADKTAAAVTNLQLQVTTLASTSESRINALSDRISTNDRRDDAQDAKIETLTNRIWQIAPFPSKGNP